ncbi:MAG TPA: TIGR03790 family protein [Tepidisphaeraceae bacterium]|nr:TIGR03790 family protein [Tepidisphaeraceae bacterium]
MKSILLRVSFLIIFFCCANLSAAPLTSDQIVLVINRAVPQSRQLAEFYASSRKIPPDRIVALDLPTIEEMPFDRYERAVAPVVRQFLRDHGVEKSIRCLVTFYGVPLRISDRINSPSDTVELARNRDMLKRVISRLVPFVQELETQSTTWDPTFKPPSNDRSIEALGQRIGASIQSLINASQRATSPDDRKKIVEFINAMSLKMAAPVQLDNVPPASAPATMPINELAERMYDPASRQMLREQVRSTGLFRFARVLQTQIDYLTTEATGSAVDSELALLWWPNYPRTQWVVNALNAHLHGVQTPPVLMVARLDAPTPQLVKDIIANSITTEREGLAGQLVVDARGIAPRDSKGQPDNFGVFDQKLRDLASLVKQKSSMPIHLDDRPDVIGTGSVDDVALYAGWYSLKHYIPGMKFNRGAVGYHIASFELVGLHGQDEGGWVHGLLSSGVVATLGPVAEPYLHSFPNPGEFFPLLMTGKMTIAEVYWSTTPLASWMQTFIGDPLYNPFAAKPAFKTEDLPPFQRALLE